MTVLVTGGAGFIGSHLVQRLVKSGENVRVFSRSPRPMSIQFLMPVDWVTADILDESAVFSAVAGVDTIYHLAGTGSPGESANQSRQTLAINVDGTLNVLLAATEHNAKKVVFASSASVYGDSPVSPKREDLWPTPRSLYAASKLSGEQLCEVFYREYGLPSVVLRFFNVYGIGAPSNLVIPRFASALEAGQNVTLYGDGNQTRDFVFVEDAVTAAISAATTEPVSQRIFNIGSGTPTRIKDVIDELARILDVSPEIDFQPARIGEIRDSVADISAAKSLLGFNPRYRIQEGLKRSFKATHVASSERKLKI
jgi:UDP-glucose 4-epimerase